ncbi:hypothetical protein UB48_24290 [Pseudomonas sp. 2(2015)]|nr:hypothetical protein UB48_24290 [Pseudomonas sp. 2(2015)]
MECFVCKADAKAIEPVGGDYQERICGGCGRYRLSGSLLAEITAQKLSLDVEGTRRWIAINSKSDPSPVLSSYEAKKHHLLHS